VRKYLYYTEEAVFHTSFPLFSYSIQLSSILYLSTCLLSSPKAYYKISMSRDGNKQRNRHNQIRMKKWNLCHLDNKKYSINTVAPAIIRWGNIYIHVFISSEIKIFIRRKNRYRNSAILYYYYYYYYYYYLFIYRSYQ
jgi:hypothetical protein